MYTYIVTVIDYDGVEDEDSKHDGLEDALRRVRELVRRAMDKENVDTVFGVKLR
jgi:hypothetical protein